MFASRMEEEGGVTRKVARGLQWVQLGCVSLTAEARAVNMRHASGSHNGRLCIALPMAEEGGARRRDVRGWFKAVVIIACSTASWGCQEENCQGVAVRLRMRNALRMSLCHEVECRCRSKSSGIDYNRRSFVVSEGLCAVEFS